MNTNSNQKYRFFLIHILVWIIIIFLPHIINPLTFDFKIFLEKLIPVGIAILAFYYNYLFLIPKYFFSNKKKYFLAQNIFICLFVSTIQTVVFIYHISLLKAPTDDVVISIFIWNVFITSLIISISIVIRIIIKWQQAEKENRELERIKTDAELQSLKNQINPHFLLNTLNNIYALIAFSPEKAQEAVMELSKLLRYMLYESNTQKVALSKEVSFIRNYIGLMKIRQRKGVVVEVNISIKENSQTMIAPLIFISLIENSFKHGISPLEDSFIEINIEENEEEVVCQIDNSYFPKNETDKSGSGIGLEQVKKRLELAYPKQYNWETKIENKIYFSRITIKT